MKAKRMVTILIVCFLVILSVTPLYAANVSINPFVDGNEFANKDDVVEMRKILVDASEYEDCDVNGDATCDVCDLVALLNYFSSFGDNDMKDEW